MADQFANGFAGSGKFFNIIGIHAAYCFSNAVLQLIVVDIITVSFSGSGESIWDFYTLVGQRAVHFSQGSVFSSYQRYIVYAQF